jgi:hypothetical protein
MSDSKLFWIRYGCQTRLNFGSDIVIIVVGIVVVIVVVVL